MLQPGTIAPAFTLVDQDEQAVTLAEQQGHWVLLWWYPKASTGG
jgi:peroxiredoxin Q/BCP